MRQYMGHEELAEMLGVPVATVRRWRYVQTGPPAVKVGRHIRYRREDVEAWLEERRQAEQATR